jgi:predicted PhzF superfamily epimerase YddE/YHI9
MKDKILVNIARVFVDKNGKFGNPVGMVIDEDRQLSDEQRQKVAAKLNFSETVFIDNLGETPVVSIFNPQHKVKFAGHAVLGTVYFIYHVLGKNINSIKCSDEIVTVKYDKEITYIVAPLSIMPSWNYEQLNSADEVENLSDEIASQKKHTYIWAWIDKSKGLVRARTFAPDWGIPEDQANGSGSMLIASKLNKNLEIHHGRGSIIFARPAGDKFAEVGGLVSVDEKKEINLL